MNRHPCRRTNRTPGPGLLLLAVSFMVTCCWAAAAWGQQGIDGAAPITIEADRMETSRQENTVSFAGNVKADQGGLTIQADEMTVLYISTGSRPETPAAEPADLSRRIATITARGNVKIVQGNWVATGDSMDFKADDRIVNLAGNARAWQDQNMVSGEKIILYLDEGRTVVERSTGDGERVRAFIYPSAQEQQDSDTP